MRVLRLLLSILVILAMSQDVFARAGKGRSSGFRDYKPQEFNYKKPDSPQTPSYQPSSPSYQKSPPTPNQRPSFLSNPIFKWLIGGMIFGAILSLLLGHGFQIGMPGLLEILLLAGIVFLMYKMFRSKREEPQHQTVSGGHLQFDEKESYATSSTLPSINQELILNLAKNAFLDIQKAWSEGDLSKVRNFTTDRIFNYLNDQLTQIQSEGLKNILKDLSIKNINIVHVEEEGEKKVVIVEIEAEGIDYTVDKSGRIVEGSPDKPTTFREYWAFVGKSLDWRLDDIKQVE